MLSYQQTKTAGHCGNSGSLRTKQPQFPLVSYRTWVCYQAFWSGGKCHFPLQPSKSRYFLLAHAGFSPFFISLHFNGSEVTQLISYFETSNYMFGSSLFSCTHELVLKDHTFSSILSVIEWFPKNDRLHLPHLVSGIRYQFCRSHLYYISLYHKFPL